MDRKQHWNAIYSTKGEAEVGWFEPLPVMSMRMIEVAGLGPDTCVVDIGGGDSRLVDHLCARGLHCVAILDVSSAALQRAQSRLGPAASAVTWLEADVTGDWSLEPMDIWHDRAVFHFLATSDDRERYVRHLRATLKPGGSAIVSTFAPSGPDRCSGLPVTRYSPQSLSELLGPEFALRESIEHTHRTPSGVSQAFQYSRLVKIH